MDTTHYLLIALTGIIALSSGCAHRNQKSYVAKRKESELSFLVKNITQVTVYATSFVYIKEKNSPRWRWDKSPVHEIKSGCTSDFVVGNIDVKSDREHVYGTLGVFNNRKDAENAIYELLPDENKVDLDLICAIKGKTIILGVEQYGLQGTSLEYEVTGGSNEQESYNLKELDFLVENKMERPVYVAGFIYQKKEDMPVWRFDKTPVVRIESNATEKIDVDVLTIEYDRKYIRAYLGVFAENEEQEAEDSTYQLLKPYQKLNLGRIANLTDKKVVLDVEEYGIMGNMIDFQIQEPHRIQHGGS